MGNDTVLSAADPLSSEMFLEIMTRECRDLLDVLADKRLDGPDSNQVPAHPSIAALTAEERNQVVRDHFANDASDYGIGIEEYLPGVTEESRIEIVNRVLAKEEYTD